MKLNRAPERHLGRRPNDPRKPRVTLRRAPGAVITPPATADFISKVPSWNMALNDQIGCCTVSGLDHIITQVEKYGQAKDVVVPDATTLAMYKAISGYNGTPATDVGATLQDALNYARKNGLVGYKPVAFAQIDATDVTLIQNCIASFGCVYTGFNFPGSAMDQFNAGKPWTYVPRSRIEGGHCVPIMAYDATSLTVVTWGETQKMDYNFMGRYFDEMWVAIYPDLMQATGTLPSGLDAADADAQYQQLTNDTTVPFQVVTPPVVVPPVVVPPVVTPPATDADGVLAASLHTWLTAKGL